MGFISPDLPPSVLYSNLNVSASTYRSTFLGRERAGGMGRCDEGMAWFWPVPLVTLGWPWWDWEEHLSFFPRGSEFGWGTTGGQECKGGSVAWWVMPGKVRLSVARAWGAEGGRGSRQLWAGAQNRKEKKKSQKVQLWPRAWPKLVHPKPVQGRHGSRVAPPACIRNSITSSATYSPAISPNSKIRKPPAPVPALHMCVPVPALVLLPACDRDRPCLCLPLP